MVESLVMGLVSYFPQSDELQARGGNIITSRIWGLAGMQPNYITFEISFDSSEEITHY